MKRHCDLCEHQILSLKDGNLCGITNRKPNFNRACVRIEFSIKLLEILEDILIDYEDLKLSKKNVYLNFILGIIISVFLFICGYLVFDYFYNNQYRVSFNKGPRAFFNYIGFLIIVSGSFLISGFYFLKKSTRNLSEHKNQLIIIENIKIEVEEVLGLYNQKYKYKIEFDREIHGIQDIEVNIELI